MCIRDRASHENQNALPVAKLGLGNPALAPHRRLIDSTINRAGLRNLDGWERQLNLVTASQGRLSRKAREVAHPQLFRSNFKDKTTLYLPVKVAPPPFPRLAS